MDRQGANSYQVGGQHYKTTYEHWDLVVDTGMGYFEGNATKYVARWRQKGGEADLQKALHYIDKLMEVAGTIVWQRNLLLDDNRLLWIKQQARLFGEANSLSMVEGIIIRTLATWKVLEDLEHARNGVLALLDVCQTGAQTVPLTEENHYSPRAGEADAEGQS